MSSHFDLRIFFFAFMNNKFFLYPWDVEVARRDRPLNLLIEILKKNVIDKIAASRQAATCICNFLFWTFSSQHVFRFFIIKKFENNTRIRLILGENILGFFSYFNGCRGKIQITSSSNFHQNKRFLWLFKVHIVFVQPSLYTLFRILSVDPLLQSSSWNMVKH